MHVIDYSKAGNYWLKAQEKGEPGATDPPRWENVDNTTGVYACILNRSMKA